MSEWKRQLPANIGKLPQSLARARLANAGVKVSPSRIQAVASRMAVK